MRGEPHYRRSKARKVSRRIPLPGVGIEKNQYFKCWNCGFVCNVDRDSLGGPDTFKEAGREIETLQYPSPTGYQEAVNPGGSTPNQLIPVYGGAVGGKTFVALAVDAQGDPVTLRRNWSPKPSGGCPMCGSPNWRGDYP